MSLQWTKHSSRYDVRSPLNITLTAWEVNIWGLLYAIVTILGVVYLLASVFTWRILLGEHHAFGWNVTLRLNYFETISGSFRVSLVIEMEGREDFGEMPWHFYDN